MIRDFSQSLHATPDMIRLHAERLERERREEIKWDLVWLQFDAQMREKQNA